MNPLSCVLPLYIGCISWTLIYDTIYAQQDIKDDKALGLKSTALYFDKNVKLWLSGFSLLTISSWLLCGYNCNISYPYYVSLSLISLHLIYQINTLKID